jgi:hypothetical protein
MNKYQPGNGSGKSGNLKLAANPKKWATEKNNTPRLRRTSEVGRRLGKFPLSKMQGNRILVLPSHTSSMCGL